MVKYSVLGSGSSGNSYIFESPCGAILIDNGFSRAELRRRVAAEGFDFSRIQAVFVTHLHPDHAKGVGTLARMDGIPVYCSTVSHEQYKDSEYPKLGIPESAQFFITDEDTVSAGGFQVKCFYTSHDSSGSVGYLIGGGGSVFTLITDTGCFNSRMVECAKMSDVLFLESNYDPKMLKEGPYPAFLKKRILGDRGHLSNQQAEEFLNQCGFFAAMTEENKCELCYNQAKSRISRIFLVHLSDTNNDVDLLEKRFSWMGSLLTVCPKGQTRTGCIGE